MDAIEAVLQTLPEHSSDLSANILKLFTQSKLTPARLWGTAVASAVATRAPALVAAVEGDAVAAGVSADVIEDARAAASLTSMNNSLVPRPKSSTSSCMAWPSAASTAASCACACACTPMPS